MFLALIEILVLEHKRGQKNVHVNFDRVTLKLDNFLQELFSLELLMVVEAEHCVLMPFFRVVGRLNQLVHKLALCVFNVTSSIKFFSQSIILRLLILFVRVIDLLAGGLSKRLKLLHDVSRQFVLLICDFHDFLQLFLEENVKIGFKLVFRCRINFFTRADLTFVFFNDKSENCFLKLGSDLNIFV